MVKSSTTSSAPRPSSDLDPAWMYMDCVCVCVCVCVYVIVFVHAGPLLPLALDARTSKNNAPDMSIWAWDSFLAAGMCDPPT